MSDKRIPLTDELYAYMLSSSLREPESLARLRREAAQHPAGCMAAAPEVGQFLSLLVRLTNASRVIELGTFMGYSALWMATALPPGGRILTIDINRQWNEVARRHWREAGMEDRIEARLSPGLVELERLLGDGGPGSTTSPSWMPTRGITRPTTSASCFCSGPVGCWWPTTSYGMAMFSTRPSIRKGLGSSASTLNWQRIPGSG